MIPAQLRTRFQRLIAWRDKEVFSVAFLDARSRLIRMDVMFYGDSNCVTVSVGEIARAACLHGAHAVVVAHNHIGNDALPSAQDARLTRRLRLAMTMVGIPLLDHLVFAGHAVHSMAELGPWQSPLEEFDAFINYDMRFCAGVHSACH